MAAQIYNMLMDYKGNVTVKIDGIAASAASVIAMAGTKLLVSPVSMMMIHNPMTVAFGNSVPHNHLMDAETWMDANKAVELGFADEIMQRSEVAEDMDTPVVSMLFYCFKHSL